MKKKIITAMMSAMLIVGTVLPVSAADQSNPNGTTTVSYEKGSSYEVSIPAISLNNTKEQTVQATSVNIVPGSTLRVTVTGISNGVVTLTRDDQQATTTTTVSTDAAGQDPIDGNTVIAEFVGNSTDFANDTTGKLYFSDVPADTAAGTYTGSITYQLAVVENQ